MLPYPLSNRAKFDGNLLEMTGPAECYSASPCYRYDQYLRSGLLLPLMGMFRGADDACNGTSVVAQAGSRPPNVHPPPRVDGRDRRGNGRVEIRGSAKLHSGGNVHPCIVLDISVCGAKAEVTRQVERPLRESLTIMLHIDGFDPLSGFVVWNVGRKLGLRFDKALADGDRIPPMHTIAPHLSS